MAKETEKQLAQMLYVEKGLTQKATAEQVGVLPKTVADWAKKEGWHNLRAAYMGTATMTVANILNSINAIIDTAVGETRPLSAKEADTIAKLTASVKNIRKELNIATYIEVFTEFGTWLSTIDLPAAKLLVNYQQTFISGKSKQIG